MLELLDEPPSIIFTTAFDEYAIKAFEASAVDYLLKPFNQQQLQNTIRNASSISRGLKDLVAVSLGSRQVLQLATVGGARHLDLAETGQLAAGYVADFIVLTTNPVTDLNALTTVHTVVQQGKAHRVDALKAELANLSNIEL